MRVTWKSGGEGTAPVVRFQEAAHEESQDKQTTEAAETYT
jgi:hypothetical protein